jgi:hypothetical protein
MAATIAPATPPSTAWLASPPQNMLFLLPDGRYTRSNSPREFEITSSLRSRGLPRLGSAPGYLKLSRRSRRYYVGIMYANGQGAPQDYQQALAWFRKAKAPKPRIGIDLHQVATAVSPRAAKLVGTGHRPREALQPFRQFLASPNSKLLYRHVALFLRLPKQIETDPPSKACVT